MTVIMNINTIQDFARVQSLEEMRNLLLKILNHYDINDFGYAVQFPTIFKKEQPYIFTGYKQDWVEHYTKNEYYKIDPTILYSAKNVVPVEWSDQLFGNNKKFREESTDAGLANGVTYPIHGAHGEKGLFCVAGKNKIPMEAFLIINALVFYLHNQILNIDLKDNPYLTVPKLTRREKEYLQWLAIGKNLDEIASIMNISYRTVVDYGEKLRKKYNCTSKQQVLTLAVTKNMINL